MEIERDLRLKQIKLSLHATKQRWDRVIWPSRVIAEIRQEWVEQFGFGLKLPYAEERIRFIRGFFSLIEQPRRELFHEDEYGAKAETLPVDPDIWWLVNSKEVARIHGAPPIFLATTKNDLELVQFLLEKGADLRVTSNKQETEIDLRGERDADGATGHHDAINGWSGIGPAVEKQESVMELAARKGYFDVTRELVLSCWEYTDFKTSMSAGKALDAAFKTALKDNNFEKAILFLVPCWRRNDRSRFDVAVRKTLMMSVAIARAVDRLAARKLLDGAGKIEISDLKLMGRRVQLFTAALLQDLSPARVEEALSNVWELEDDRAQLFRDAVRFECNELLASPSMQRFLKRRWSGRLIEQVVDGKVYHMETGIYRDVPRSARLMTLILFVCILIPLNLGVLPFVAVFPPFEKALLRYLDALPFIDGLQLRPRYMYLLNVPCVKFYLWEAAFIGLAIMLTWLDITPHNSTASADQRRLQEYDEASGGVGGELEWRITPFFLLTYLTTGAALLSEVIELLPELKFRESLILRESESAGETFSENFDLWALDRLNLLELPGLFLAFAALSLVYVDETLVYSSQALTSLALMLLWTASGFRLVSLLPELGPMVRMATYMTRDVFQWLILLMIVLLAFSAATFVSVKSRYDSEEGIDAYSEDDACAVMIRQMQDSFSFTAMHLLKIAVGSSVDMDYDCQTKLQASAGRVYQFVAPLITITWTIISVVLAMNMLIASMAKSFERVWNEHLLHSHAIFAQNVLVWHMEDPAPPPLNLLQLPYEMCHVLHTLCHNCALAYDGYYHDRYNRLKDVVERKKRREEAMDENWRGYVSRTFRKRAILQFETQMWREVDRHTHDKDKLDFKLQSTQSSHKLIEAHESLHRDLKAQMERNEQLMKAYEHRLAEQTIHFEKRFDALGSGGGNATAYKPNYHGRSDEGPVAPPSTPRPRAGARGTSPHPVQVRASSPRPSRPKSPNGTTPSAARIKAHVAQAL
jgi:hypothetical protein